MPHHLAPGQVQPHAVDLPLTEQTLPAHHARAQALQAVTAYAATLATYLPITLGAPYDPVRTKRRAKRQEVMEEVFLPQALFDLLVESGEAGRIASKALVVDTPTTLR